MLVRRRLLRSVSQARRSGRRAATGRIFILAYTFLLICALGSLANGEEAYKAFLAALNSPLGILFNLVTLVVTVYHSTSWFNVTPQAMPIQRGEEFVPGNIIVSAHYGAWAVISIIVLFLGVF